MRRSYAGFFTQVHVKKILETTGPGIISASDWSTVRLPVEEVEVLCASDWSTVQLPVEEVEVLCASDWSTVQLPVEEVEVLCASDWSTVRLPVEEVEVLCAGEPLLEPVLVGNGLLLVHLRLHDDGRHHEYGVVVFTVSVDFCLKNSLANYDSSMRNVF